MTKSQLAGWQIDPTGRHQHRWWDGSRWTGHVSDRGVMSSDPSEVPTPPPRPANSWAPARAPVLGPVEKHRNSTAVFILGLLGMLLCFVLAPIAWIMGSNARGEIQRSQGRLESDGLLTAGWIMGIIGTVLIGAIVIAILIAVAAAA